MVNHWLRILHGSPIKVHLDLRMNVRPWPQICQFQIDNLGLKMNVRPWPQMCQFRIDSLGPKMNVRPWPQMCLSENNR